MMEHCRCGRTRWHGLSAAPCEKCDYCKSGPALRKPLPHSWKLFPSGATKCRWCMKQLREEVAA